MPVTRGLKLSTRTVGRLTVTERDEVFWDRDLPGFGVRVYPSGTKTFVVQSRGEGRSRRITIGRHGAMTAGEARRRAARIIARIKYWDDPAPPAPARAEVTVAELAARYLEEHVAIRCKPRTRVLYRAAVRQYIVPALGEAPVSSVRREQVAALHHALRETPYAANRAVHLLARILDMAEDEGLRPRGANPCRSIEKFRERPHERFLSEGELRRLGRVLEAAAGGGAGPRRPPSRPSGSSCSPAAGGARSSVFAGSKSTSRRASCVSPTARRARGWCPSRPPPRR